LRESDIDVIYKSFNILYFRNTTDTSNVIYSTMMEVAVAKDTVLLLDVRY